MKIYLIGLLFITCSLFGQYAIVDTGQTAFFNNKSEIQEPELGDNFYGQDAHFDGNQPSYTNNGDGTISDNVTGLMWTKSFEVLSYDDAIYKAKNLKLNGYNDWRVPTIKEAYSLILFSGKDASLKNMYKVPNNVIPFIDTDYFDFEYAANGDRVIDTQVLSSTIYNGTTMNGAKTVFGVNIADGRIKGYPLTKPKNRQDNKFTVYFVRGNENYGKNNFSSNKSTVLDSATGLMWDKNDSKKGLSWEEALKWVQEKNSENYLGFSNWRLPNAKELHSIVDYSRSPQETNSAAIDPIFNISEIDDEAGETNYPFFWTSTTLENSVNGTGAVFIAFGEALGYVKNPRSGEVELKNVHGAGAQKSDRKVGNPSDYPTGHGPQGGVIRIYNYVRLVRDI